MVGLEVARGSGISLFSLAVLACFGVHCSIGFRFKPCFLVGFQLSCLLNQNSSYRSLNFKFDHLDCVTLAHLLLDSCYFLLGIWHFFLLCLFSAAASPDMSSFATTGLSLASCVSVSAELTAVVYHRCYDFFFMGCILKWVRVLASTCLCPC